MRFDDALERRRLPAAPDGIGLPAPLSKPLCQRRGASLIGEPTRIPHACMHCNAERERTAGDAIVDNRRHSVDPHRTVKTLSGEGGHRVGDEVFCSQTFFNVCDELRFSFKKIRAIATHVGRFGELMLSKRGPRGERGTLAGAFERVKGLVINPSGLIREFGHAESVVEQSRRVVNRRARAGYRPTSWEDSRIKPEKLSFFFRLNSDKVEVL